MGDISATQEGSFDSSEPLCPQVLHIQYLNRPLTHDTCYGWMNNWLITISLGSIRRHRDSPNEECPRPRCLPPCIFQEHSRNRASHQRLEARACCQIPRGCTGAQESCPNEEICWWNWSCCTGYVILGFPDGEWRGENCLANGC